MTNDQIRKLALENGFKLKKQPDGTEDLNPYVYAFARALISARYQSDLQIGPPPVLTAGHEIDI